MSNLIDKLRDLSRKSLMRNILWLYGVHFVNYLVPFITIPYLTRVLMLEGWGLFALIQSFALYLMTIVEYNFIMSGTRDVSVARDDRQRRSELLAGVTGAKLLLSVIVGVISISALFVVPTLREHPYTFLLGILWSVTWGFNYLWYFQGLEKMQVAAALDVLAKIVATIGIFLFVKGAEDVGLIFLIYTAANILSLAMSLVLAYREVPFIPPNYKTVREALQTGGSLFFARMLAQVYYMASVFLVGLFAQAETAGIYAGADKLSKGFAALTGPITYALYPRLSHLFQSDREKAKQLFRKSAALMIVVGVALSVTMFMIAPIYTTYYLGPGFDATILVIRWLTLSSILLAFTNLFVLQWMLPLGFDKEYLRVTGITVIVHIPLAWVFVTNYGAIGMAWAVLLTQAFEVFMYNAILWIKHAHPWQDF